MNSNQDLTEKIEKLVRELMEAHMEETRVAVVGAVTRALTTWTGSTKGAKGAVPKRSRAPRQRRDPEQVAQLAERLYAAVCDNAGEAMVVLSAELGASARQLHRPMTNLKRAGRVRSVGQRHRTRYFPAVVSEAAGASSQSA